MMRLIACATALLATILLHDAAAAAESGACLTPEQRRAALQSRKAVPLGRAVRTAKARHAGDLLNAQLCRQDKGLVYVLTVLARDGKVMHLRVDADSGKYIEN